MRVATVYVRGRGAGRLSELDDGSVEFAYAPGYLTDADAPPVSLTLPKRGQPYRSPSLFPAFFQLLPEGHNKRVLCETLRVDPDDEFSILLRVAGHDTVGAITVRIDDDGE